MATWNGVITNAGNSLLNEWVNEKALNFDSAAAGQGTVAAAAMMAQTAALVISSCVAYSESSLSSE